jgi:ribonucleoside-diphosphate reductase alpha chain
MRKLEEGDSDARRKWGKLLQKRKATGEPYIMYKGNVNKQNPDMYKKNGLKVHMTNICSEIVYIPMSNIHLFVAFLH